MIEKDRITITGLCEKANKIPVETVEELRASGSPRRYYRVKTGKQTLIACCSENVEENEVFIRMSEMLAGGGVAVPSVFAATAEKDCYLQEDLGEEDLMGEIKRAHSDQETWRHIDEAIEELVKLQTLPASKWENTVGFEPLGEQLIDYDFQYAIDNLIEPAGVSYDKDTLKKEMSDLKQRLLAYPPRLWGLMYRDFQSRNIMIKERPYLIDFQSARKGPGIYDLVSFAWQAKAGFTPEERDRIVEIYVKKQSDRGIEAEMEVKLELGYWVIFRIMQTLGAYGLRGLKEGKQHFIQSIPGALRNLMECLKREELKGRYPELERIAIQLGEKFRD